MAISGFKQFHGKEGEYVYPAQLFDWIRDHPMPDGRMIPTLIWGSKGTGKTQQIKAAALDVLVGDSEWKSTIPPENTLYQYAMQNNNLLLTPHIGGYGKVSIQKTRDFITQKFIKSIKNETHTYS
jgi:hypothetical protein